jgi:hypothetical protein
VNADRVSVDFGDLGKVSLRNRNISSSHPRDECFAQSFDFGVFDGAIRFDGESAYTRVRDRRPIGGISVGGSESCPEVVVPDRAREEGSILGTCGGEPGAGLFAAEDERDGPADFLGSSIERSQRMLILRTLYARGPSRTLKLSADRRSGVIRPPEPFIGRAWLSDGRLTGNLRALLPGGGLVRLTPGNVTVSGFEDFEFPHCFPYSVLDDAGSSAAGRLGRVIGR